MAREINMARGVVMHDKVPVSIYAIADVSTSSENHSRSIVEMEGALKIHRKLACLKLFRKSRRLAALMCNKVGPEIRGFLSVILYCETVGGRPKTSSVDYLSKRKTN